MIKPTVGRVVIFRRVGSGEEFAAIVAKVWSERMVNLAVFDENGCTFGQTSVPLLQDDDTPGGSSIWCQWMPYQKGQAAKNEKLEEQLAGKA